MFGYHNKILRVDLTTRKVSVQELDDGLIKKYLGGAGLCARILYDETGPDIDPLGVENVLVAFTGPFTDTRVPSTSRHHIMACSPLTGVLGESSVGGSWGVHFKRTGHDGLVITGKSVSPVYIWIHDDGVEIRDAELVWGKDSVDSAEWLKSETHPKATVATIGPAGERLVRFASISHVGEKIRSAGRTGMGAVMGSKNLKAIVAFGTKTLAQADPDALWADLKQVIPHITKVTKAFGKFGTSGGVDNYERIGNFPIKNWSGSRWEGAQKISGAAMHDTVLSGRTACLKCPIACGRQIKITAGKWGPLDGEGPEYETVGTMGGECLVDDLEAICKANDLCNRYGLDTMSTGATIAFAMELYERGILSKEDTDGLELTWGNGEVLVELVERIALRKGIGRLMGEGSLKMAQKIGKNAIEYTITVKGLEPSAHDPRRFWSQALSYATAARGACHNASWGHAYELALSMEEIGIPQPFESYQAEGLAEFVATMQDYQSVNDALIICRFVQVGKAVTATNLVNWINMITGQGMDLAEFMKIGERIFTLKRLYNTRLGISRKDDTLPPRFMTLNRKDPELTNQLPPIGRLLGDYYEYRNWSEEGYPLFTKLSELGLEK
ncbi:MAG: aldehyde ferredoxin oxidoreductase family protein [Proteobacteria bacterium]|nr:aldehyde ferredoxin oxidoreductase family protein [Pseudomonadota bacterium]MBU1060502.1 aldehyde ferredoxin oxidoreductase family protein [Pseudomonadota bacterium]